jgi:GNAT superfamily N-acetyltransferase
MSIEEYVVALARSEHIRLLPEIERAAAALFPDDVITAEIRASAVPREQLEAALVEKRLWTAVTRAGNPVGFAIAVRESGRVLLQEIDVHPNHQRKGLGRRLIQEVIGWAKAQALSCVTLTTFEHVPWNAPFYSRLGFRKLADDELGCELFHRLQIERQQGLRQRVAMQLTLDPEQPMQPACEDARR